MARTSLPAMAHPSHLRQRPASHPRQWPEPHVRQWPAAHLLDIGRQLTLDNGSNLTSGNGPSPTPSTKAGSSPSTTAPSFSRSSSYWSHSNTSLRSSLLQPQLHLLVPFQYVTLLALPPSAAAAISRSSNCWSHSNTLPVLPLRGTSRCLSSSPQPSQPHHSPATPPPSTQLPRLLSAEH